MADIVKASTNIKNYDGVLQLQHKASMSLAKDEMKFQSAFNSYPKEMQEKVKSSIVESAMWKGIAEQPTPTGILKEREAGKGKMLEYFTEYYTISELDRLFPGWWTEDMKTTYIPEVRTFITEGYLLVEYPTLNGMKIRKIYAVGAAEVFGKVEAQFVPSQPDDRAKSARTEWIKLAGKWLGIGLDIYSQTITVDLIRDFEDRIRDWGIYAEPIKEVVSTIETGHAFRKYMKSIPTAEQSQKFLSVIHLAPEDKQQGLWQNFVKLSNRTDEERKKSDDWVEVVTNRIKQFSSQTKKEG